MRGAYCALRGLSDQAPARKIAHQVSHAKRPRRDLVAVIHAVDERAEFARTDRHNITAFVGESLADFVTVLNRSELRSQEQHHAVRELMSPVNRLFDEIERIAADSRKIAYALKTKPV